MGKPEASVVEIDLVADSAMYSSAASARPAVTSSAAVTVTPLRTPSEAPAPLSTLRGA
jgi:hypothetical protein